MANFDIQAMKTLAKHAVSGTVPTNFEKVATVADVEETLREACRELAPDFYSYERNKTYIFEIIQTAIDEILPKKVLATVGQFAEVQQFGLGQIPRFELKTGRNRAKKFVTRVAAEGIYETFRLDKKYIDVEINTYGGATVVDFERYLVGDEDFGEYAAIVMEGLEEAVYKEIWAALKGAAKELKAVGDHATNYAYIASTSGAVYGSAAQTSIQKLCTTAKRYGNGSGAMIISTAPVLQKFVNDTSSSFTPNIAGSDIDEIKANGLIGRWKGVNLVELPNSFEDETNKTTVLDDGYAFVFPTGRDTKVVKVAMEGQTMVDDFKNRDRSMELQAYKRFGVAILTYNNWCMFIDGEFVSPDPTL